MKVFLACSGEREALYRDILGGFHYLEKYVAEDAGPVSGPGEGDVLLLDLSEKGGDWKGELRTIRRRLGEKVMILAVLRYDQIRVLGAEDPADDFILEGSTGEELRARIRRLRPEQSPGIREKGGLVIDEDRYEVRLDGVPVELTFKEFELLRFLASRPGKVFTREVLLEQVWGYDYFGGARTVDVHIRRIRSKIEREGRTYIRTVRGVGYIFEPSQVDPS